MEEKDDSLTELMNEGMIYESVCKTALATLGLFTRQSSTQRIDFDITTYRYSLVIVRLWTKLRLLRSQVFGQAVRPLCHTSR